MLTELSVGALACLDKALAQDFKAATPVPTAYSWPLLTWLRAATARELDARATGETARPLRMPNIHGEELTVARTFACALALSFSPELLTLAAHDEGRRLALTPDALAQVGECQHALMRLAESLDALAGLTAPAKVH